MTPGTPVDAERLNDHYRPQRGGERATGLRLRQFYAPPGAVSRVDEVDRPGPGESVHDVLTSDTPPAPGGARATALPLEYAGALGPSCSMWEGASGRCYCRPVPGGPQPAVAAPTWPLTGSRLPQSWQKRALGGLFA